MGQSVDYRKIELVSQFAGLLEALSDPTLKDTLVEARKVIEEKKALLGPLAEKANLDALIDREEAKLGDRKAKMEELFKQAEEEVSRIKAQAKVKDDEAAANLAATKTINLEAKAGLDHAKVEVAQALEFKKEVEKSYEDLKKREAECDAREASLKDKLEKLTLVLGNN